MMIRWIEGKRVITATKRLNAFAGRRCSAPGFRPQEFIGYTSWNFASFFSHSLGVHCALRCRLIIARFSSLLRRATSFPVTILCPIHCLNPFPATPNSFPVRYFFFFSFYYSFHLIFSLYLLFFYF